MTQLRIELCGDQTAAETDMLTQFLRFNLDIAAFTALVLLATAVVHLIVRRSSGAGGLSRGSWIILLLMLVAGSSAAISAGRSERSRLQGMLQGFPPTYAIEAARLEHSKITHETAKDDAGYLRLIETEKQWLKVNPAVNDIYTFRKNKDGKVAFVVDSETDYDHNGKYEQEREERTAIGEVYDDPTDGMLQALQGQSTFDGEPYTDRWGTWVSAFEPILGADGKVEAALGVDYDASQWVSAIVQRRVGVMGLFAIAIVVLVWSGSIITMMHHEAERRKKTERSLRESEARIRAIVDHEPESVFVLDGNTRILESNPAAMAMLELNGPDETIGQAISGFISTEQRAAFEEWIKRVLKDGAPSTLSVTAIAKRSGPRFIEAHAVRLVGDVERGDALLIVARDITAQRLAEAEREKLHDQLMNASRRAGMAEIATGVLHNIGNVLNTVNISNHVLLDKVRQSKVSGLRKAATLLKENEASLPTFLSEDARGKQVPGYLDKLAGLLELDQADMHSELQRMSESLEHMKAIVHSQQAHAKNATCVDESLRAQALFEDALKLNIASCERHHVQIMREFEEMPPIVTDKHKVLQILCNLIINSKRATKDANKETRTIILRLRHGSIDGQASVRFEVEDNGVGISPENLRKIFGMGFTTRDDGHGFGLHSAANYAKELGGSLKAYSDGVGAGARFVLEIPAVPSRTRQNA